MPCMLKYEYSKMTYALCGSDVTRALDDFDFKSCRTMLHFRAACLLDGDERWHYTLIG